MPFCRECEKEVEHDWVTCPFCSQTIGPPNLNSQKVQDSVIMGDVNTNINDSASISAAMKTTLKCSKCHSTGAILIGCERCGEHVGCSLCIDDIALDRRYQVTGHSDDINWYYENYKSLTNKYPRSSFYEKYCQPCWDSEKEEYLASSVKSCSEHKQKIIANRKESLVEVYNFTKRDVEALNSSEDEVYWLEYNDKGVYEAHFSILGSRCMLWDRRMGLKEEYGYTDEYITENLQLISIDNSGSFVKMTELEWSSYLSTLTPLQGYKGMSLERQVEALKNYKWTEVNAVKQCEERKSDVHQYCELFKSAD